MGFVFGVLRFFRFPLQVALGLYFAFMMLMFTAAGIAYFAEGFDSVSYTHLTLPTILLV